MGVRALLLLLFAVLPGAVFSGMSAYALFFDWAALSASHDRYSQLASTPTPNPIELSIAEAAETRHRINCLAEGGGVLLGTVILAIGVHGLCLLPDRPR